MNEILNALLEDAGVAEFEKVFTRTGEFFVYGAAGSQKVAAFSAVYKKNPRPTVILTGSREKIFDWSEDLKEFLPEVEVAELPEPDLMTVNATASGIERRAKRLEILSRLVRGENFIVLASPPAAVKKDLSRKDFEKIRLKIEVGQKIRLEDFISRLVNLGYERLSEVDNLGKFSVRGGIVDIFAINSPKPYRIEFFDEEIDSVREFNLETKRSEKNISVAEILPISGGDEKNSEPFLTCAGENSAVIFDEPSRIDEAIKNLVKENPDLKKNIFDFPALVKNSGAGSLIYLEMMKKKIRGINPESFIQISSEGVPAFHGQKDFFVDEISRLEKRDRKIFILSGNSRKLEGIKNFLAEKNFVENDFLKFLPGSLQDGFAFPGANLTVFTEKDIFGSRTSRRTKRFSENAGERIKHFRDINPGDYVVHPENGIGKYIGAETLEFDGIKRDYIQIQYGGEDKLYIPVDQVQYLQKYISDDGEAPRLSKLGSGDWSRAKSRASAAVEDIAKKLLEIYARRESTPGFAFDPDDATQADFEDAFPYEETPDQIRAVEEIKADMERSKPMNRLVCGDVGFGKTEIAIRAAYKAAMNGKQCAVLVPTTVLAWQHYHTFKERLSGFLPTVDVICRFRTPKEQKKTLQNVKAGNVDILIGTHAILNTSRIHFKDLGLLIIDEEQRFGVKQKEKIRSLSAGVDVLTLSATPIPRTLHMSLIGAGDMSLIETPPAERFPVQTYIVEDEDEILSEAIRREIRRGGQVYFVYNRIETIDFMRDRLAELVPEAKIQTAHGQQSEDLLEQIMMDFYDGAFNVLLCTTIIENGLNVANANTIIIYDADSFGLAQLYQMRGRVGRSHRLAFAYFVHRSNKVLNETAEKRLRAMQEFAKLGAGFKIAMRDLEIRGAGNLLGAEQHGHIASVGFEMYCQLLNEAVARLAEKPPEKISPEPAISLSSIDAYIDDEYISDSMHKVEIYKRLTAIEKISEVDDLLDELIDRFGEPSKNVLNLLQVAKIKCLAKKLNAKSLTEKNLRVELILDETAKISPEGLGKLLKLFGKRIKVFHESRTVVINLTDKKILTDLIIKILKILR